MCFSIESFCCILSVEVGAQVISIMFTLLSGLLTVLYACAAVFQTLSPTKQVFYAGMAVAAGLQCLFGGLLGYGAFQRRPKLMWPWLLTAWVTGGGLLVVSIIGTGTLIVGGQLSSDVNVVVFAYVLYSLFLFYCACVVNSRRMELDKKREYIETAETFMRDHHHHPDGHHTWRYA